jgi:GNAT superfamily N-acetyltransferase
MTADYARDIAAGRVWVRTCNHGVAGVVVVRVAAEHLLVENVAVDPQWQGRGLGAALLDFAESYALSQGMTTICLYTNELMTENLAYYPRRGFVETGRRTEDGFRRVFFAKVLRGA